MLHTYPKHASNENKKIIYVIVNITDSFHTGCQCVPYFSAVLICFISSESTFDLPKAGCQPGGKIPNCNMTQNCSEHSSNIIHTCSQHAPCEPTKYLKTGFFRTEEGGVEGGRNSFSSSYIKNIQLANIQQDLQIQYLLLFFFGGGRLSWPWVKLPS